MGRRLITLSATLGMLVLLGMLLRVPDGKPVQAANVNNYPTAMPCGGSGIHVCPTKTATATKCPANTATATATMVPTNTATETATATATMVPTNTATATDTMVPTNTATATATATATMAPTNTATATATMVPTSTATPTPVTPTATPTQPPGADYYCVQTNIGKGLYFNDFESPTNPGKQGWSNFYIDTAPNGQKFNGQWGNDHLKLKLGCLPPHTSVKISFDLYIIRTWDGNISNAGGPVGPDHWYLTADGKSLVNTTFTNWNMFPQAYPGSWPTGSYPARTGSSYRNTLGYYDSGQPLDTIYTMTFDIPHTGDYLTLDFFAEGLQPVLTDESWGLDNFSATINSSNLLLPRKLYVPFAFN